MTTHDSFIIVKRKIYLTIIPLSLMVLLVYTILTKDSYTLLTLPLIGWYSIGWLIVYKNKYMKVFEKITLVLITFIHIGMFYDTVVNYMAVGVKGAIGITIIWVPIIIFSFFLVYQEKIGLIYSLFVLFILITIGTIHFSQIPRHYQMDLFQFYIGYLIYIFSYFFAQRVFKHLLELESLKKAAYVDSLTGIANRHMIDSWLEQRLSNLKHAHLPLTLVFIDIDHFKCVNDTYGHRVGDSVLIELSEKVKQRLQNDDLFGRWGGEEFMVITHRTLESAASLAEELREMIESHQFNGVGSITASFGVAEGQVNDTADSLLGRADSLLYKSKQNGRNSVTI